MRGQPEPPPLWRERQLPDIGNFGFPVQCRIVPAEGGQSWFTWSRVGQKGPRRCGNNTDLFRLLRVSLATIKNRLVGIFSNKTNNTFCARLLKTKALVDLWKYPGRQFPGLNYTKTI